MSDLAEQIDALLALNAKGAVSHPVPGLAVELLTKAAAALRASPAPLPVTVTDEVVERFQNAYRQAGEKRHWQPSWPDAEASMEILTAALSKPGDSA